MIYGNRKRRVHSRSSTSSESDAPPPKRRTPNSRTRRVERKQASRRNRQTVRRSRRLRGLSPSGSDVEIVGVYLGASPSEMARLKPLGLGTALFAASPRPARRKQSHISVITISSGSSLQSNNESLTTEHEESSSENLGISHSEDIPSGSLLRSNNDNLNTEHDGNLRIVNLEETPNEGALTSNNASLSTVSKERSFENLRNAYLEEIPSGSLLRSNNDNLNTEHKGNLNILHLEETPNEGTLTSNNASLSTVSKESSSENLRNSYLEKVSSGVSLRSNSNNSSLNIERKEPSAESLLTVHPEEKEVQVEELVNATSSDQSGKSLMKKHLAQNLSILETNEEDDLVETHSVPFDGLPKIYDFRMERAQSVPESMDICRCEDDNVEVVNTRSDTSIIISEIDSFLENNNSEMQEHLTFSQMEVDNAIAKDRTPQCEESFTSSTTECPFNPVLSTSAYNSSQTFKLLSEDSSLFIKPNNDRVSLNGKSFLVNPMPSSSSVSKSISNQHEYRFKLYFGNPQTNVDTKNHLQEKPQEINNDPQALTETQNQSLDNFLRAVDKFPSSSADPISISEMDLNPAERSENQEFESEEEDF